MKTTLSFAGLVLLAASSAGAGAATAAADARQQEVRDKGAGVMPFALDKTLHTFDKTRDGGIQRVRVRGADAAEQIARIRMHLSEIARSFAQRDFAKPEHIHGAGMPGLALLRAAAPGDLEVAYHELADGAEIDYVAHTPALVAAVHEWFDAQLSDHGRDAATSAPASLAAFAWLAGRWELDDGGRHVEEIWTEPAADLMLGMSRTLQDQRTSSFEFMRIALRPDGVVYIAQPRGKPPVEFPLQSWDGRAAVFVNPGNEDRLKRIVYRRDGAAGMTARIEGAANGADFAEDYAYRRAGEPALPPGQTAPRP